MAIPSPSALDSGTLILNYVYVDNAGLSKAPGGSVSIPYQAIAANNVIGTVSPVGQVAAAVGGMQSVSINFTTDTDNATDDSAATNLSVSTNLAALPAELIHEHLGMAAPVLIYDRCWLVMSLAELGGFAEAVDDEAEALRLAEPTQRAASVGLAHLLPAVVDHVTPSGQLPSGAQLDDALSGLMKRLGA